MDYVWINHKFGNDIGHTICQYHKWNKAEREKIVRQLLCDLLEATKHLEMQFNNGFFYKPGKTRIALHILRQSVVIAHGL